MRLLAGAWFVALQLLLPTAAAAGESDEVMRVRAGDRLAWDQRVPRDGIDAVRFKAYIDGAPRAIDVACERSSDAMTFACLATLPSLSPGVHVIAIAAHVRGNERMEGPRSTTIRVRVDDQLPEALMPTPARPASETSRAFARMKSLASFVDITDIAVLDDGNVIVAERFGVVHLLGRNGEARATIALGDVRVEYGGLLSVAAESFPDGSHNLYAMYASHHGLRVSRISVDRFSLASPGMVLVDGLRLSAEPWASVVRIGPDGKLYLAIEDGGVATLLGDASSYQGKVLRLNTDGTTPRDAPRHSPVYAIGLSQPTGLAWVGKDESFLVVGSGSEGLGRLETRASGRRDRSVALSWMPSRAVTYYSTAHRELAGSVLIGDARDGGVWRATVEADGAVRVAEMIDGTNVGPIRAIATSPDGAVYAATKKGLWSLLAASQRPKTP